MCMANPHGMTCMIYTPCLIILHLPHRLMDLHLQLQSSMDLDLDLDIGMNIHCYSVNLEQNIWTAEQRGRRNRPYER
jgi:hypothetical protein